MNKKRIVIFASGRGSNAAALYDAMQAEDIQGTLVAVICDHQNAQILKRAAEWQVPTVVIEMKDKETYHKEILKAVKSYHPDLICLAGYMRICDETLVNAYPNQIVNIHPALLPSFKGLHAQRQAIEAGVKISGCTVHFVGTGLDDGPIIIQAAVPVYDNDTEDTLSQRILKEEHKIYVKAVKAFCEDRLEMKGRQVIGINKEEKNDD